MKLHSALTIVTLSTGLLIACGGDSSSGGPSSSLNPACATVNCQPTINWKIFLQGKNFPQPAKVVIDGEIVLNECLNKQKYEIDRAVTPESLALPAFKSPSASTVAISVIDMGDCSGASESTSISEHALSFEVTKIGEASELVIHL